jgi:hypothetical protein
VGLKSESDDLHYQSQISLQTPIFAINIIEENLKAWCSKSGVAIVQDREQHGCCDRAPREGFTACLDRLQPHSCCEYYPTTISNINIVLTPGIHMPEIIIRTTKTDNSGFIATVTLSNEQRLNCINSELAMQLTSGIKKLGENPDLRAVKLQGAGKRAFIGGADIREMAELTPETAKAFITTLHQACAALRELPVPVVAQISGYCFGAGLEIAASCDLRIADHSASFAMPEVQIGLPSVIEAALLPRLIGAGRAAQLVYTGTPINSETAYQWGFI